jgi:glycogen debranching enzyme
VWPWLIGHFAHAWLRTFGDRDAVREMLAAFPGHLRDAGVGSISEIFDATPPFVPRGCIAQAWSVAEVLRATLAASGETAARANPPPGESGAQAAAAAASPSAEAGTAR